VSKLLYAINTIAVLALLFAYLSPFISPASSSFFSFFGLGYPFLFLVNAMFFFFWLAFKPKYAILSGLFLALGIGSIQKIIGFDSSDKESSGLEIMTYNIGKTRIDFHYKDRQKKIDRFKKFIAQQKPDIICLQERLPRHLKYYDEIFVKLEILLSTRSPIMLLGPTSRSRRKLSEYTLYILAPIGFLIFLITSKKYGMNPNTYLINIMNMLSIGLDN